MTTIFFATNRELLPDGNPSVFGPNFSQDGLANLRFGRAEVTGDRFESVSVRVASEDLFTDPPLLGSQQIFTQVQQEMKQNAEDTLILIHGFNTTFRDALRMAAQIHRNLTRPNPTTGQALRLNVCLFSWPSDGSLLLTNPSSRDAIAYKNDRLDAAASGAAFARGFLKVADFINSLRENERCTQRLHLLTHSMGTYVLRYAVQQLRGFVNDRIPRIFDQVLLVASDEDDDTFDHDYKLHLLPRLTRHVNVYFNRNDIALWASDRVKGNPVRLGTDGPMQPFQLPRNVYAVDCTRVIPRLSGTNEQHSYHINVARVISDIQQILLNRPADEVAGRTYVPDSNRYRLE